MDDFEKEIELSCRPRREREPFETLPIEDRVRRLEAEMDRTKDIFDEQFVVIKRQQKDIEAMQTLLKDFQREMKDIVEDGFDAINRKLDKRYERQDDIVRDVSKMFMPKGIIIWVLALLISIGGTALGTNFGYTYIIHQRVSEVEKKFAIHDKFYSHEVEELRKRLPAPIPPGS